MKRIGQELSRIIGSLDGDAARFMSVALNNERYREAVRSVWADPDAARLILEGTNGFYVREDTSPRKGPRKDEPYMVSVVCAADALIRSELDAHRELLHLKLREAGMQTEELRIVPARRGMKERHPFRESGAAS